MNALSRPGPGGRPRALKAIPRPKEPGDTPVESVTSGSSPLAPFVGPGPAAGPRGPAGPSTAQDVPTDGNSYLRSDAGWVSGGRVANELTVAPDPAKPLGVATKQYVDNTPPTGMAKRWNGRGGSPKPRLISTACGTVADS